MIKSLNICCLDEISFPQEEHTIFFPLPHDGQKILSFFLRRYVFHALPATYSVSVLSEVISMPVSFKKLIQSSNERKWTPNSANTAGQITNSSVGEEDKRHVKEL